MTNNLRGANSKAAPRASAQNLQDARKATALAFKHDAALPITAQREALLEALRNHQVLVVAGETGSGKSTQLPQYCLELGRGVLGLIAHTQPRRLAARALATRIAEEVSQPLGHGVGYRVRFADQVSDATRLVLMTDGLLLAELSSDPMLRAYDTIIVDEAHERTLNVDLLLGVLKQLLPRRPDLKLIVTSATLDVERMAQYLGDVPIIRVSGRNHPIEVRYTDMREDADDPDLPAQVLKAFESIAAEPGHIGRGDVLVFLPGEREIRDVSEYLERELQSRVEVLSLYSRLAWEQQSKIFQKGARQRIVLSTNVAETSVTVPGIRSVIDSGLARISRYSIRNRLQRLPIEAISRASADQRKGRCGRIGAGLCMRLFSEEDFAARPEFTEPEVLRTNLAALLLRLAADGLGAAEEFPFIDPPDSRALNDGYRLLQELQALDGERGITRHGRAMARLPLDPRLARAVLESQRFRAEAEVLAIAAGLSVPDVRIQRIGPAAADEADPAAAFDDPKSEFSALNKLWRAYRKAREGPRRELRRWCKERQLSMLRLSEWEDVYNQVVDRARDMGIVAQSKAASYTGVHRALLAGFCTMVGVRGEDGVYLGTRGVHFHLFPGSPLVRRRPRWVMAANIVETSRVFARRVAEVEPNWIESAAAHLSKREYLEPDWDESREEVVARERVSFLGLILSANKVVNYGPIAPEEARLIFAREALVYHRLPRRPDWLTANDAQIAEAQRMEERLRARDIVQAPEVFIDFYAQALPRQVSSAATLEYFSRHLTDAQLDALTLTPERVFARRPTAAELEQFPESTQLDSFAIPVEYHFAPGEAVDGATLNVPLLALPGLTRSVVDAAIPGLAAPRIEALLRSLPKDARRHLIPIGETVQRFLREQHAAGTHGAADVQSLKRWLKEQRGIPEAGIRFDTTALPAHLMPQFAVIDATADGPRDIARGPDLTTLRRLCATRARAALDRHALRVHSHPLTWRRFEYAALPDLEHIDTGQGALAVFPTLAVQAQGLVMRFEWSAVEAERQWREAAVRLARALLATQAKDMAKAVSRNVPLILRAAPYLAADALSDVLLQIVFRAACFADLPAPRSRAAFEAAVERGRERLYAGLDTAIASADLWFTEAAAVRQALDDPRNRSAGAALEESRAHLHALLDGPFIRSLSSDWLRQLPRYLKAEQRRWQRNAARGGESAGIGNELRLWTERHRALYVEVSAESRWIAQLDELRLWIEEFRVSLYAQELKTLGPISAARLDVRAAEIEAWIRR